MGKFLEYVNKSKKEEEEKKKSSSSSSQIGNFGRVTIGKSLGLDTLGTDISSVNSSLSNVYSSWQTPETMRNTRASVQGVYDRLGKYQEYQQKYGGTDLSELQSTYKSVLDNWDDLEYTYSGYGNADDWKKAVKTSQEMKTADIGVVGKEIEELEGILATAKPYADELKGLTAGQSAYEANKNRIAGNLPEGYYSKPMTETSGKLNDYLASVGYGSVEEIEKALGEKKVYYNNASRMQELIKLSSVGDINSENYDKDYNKYVESGKALSTERVGGFLNKDYKNHIGHLRANPEMLEAYETATDSQGAAYESIMYNNTTYLAAKYMTDEEYDNYSYYLGKGDTEGANRYIELIGDAIRGRQGRDIADNTEGFLKSLNLAYESGIDQFTQGVMNNFNNADYIPTTGKQIASSKVRSDIIDTYGDAVGYDIVNTGANMLPSILTSTAMNYALPGSGTFVGAGMMGTSARGNAYQEMLNLGYDKSQAHTYANLVGASEAGLQYVLGGISKLGGTSKTIGKLVSSIDNGFARFAIRYPMAMASEGAEEGLQEVLTPMFKNIAAGYDTGAKVDWGEVAYSTLLGALSAGVMDGPSLATEVSRETQFNNAVGKNIKFNERAGDVFDLASISPEASEAYQTYTQYAKKGINAENVSNYKLGNLYSQTRAEAEAVLKSKNATEEQITKAVETLFKLESASQKSFDKELVVAMMANGLKSAEGTEAHALAKEYMEKLNLTEAEVSAMSQKLAEGKKLTAEEKSKFESIKKLSDEEFTKVSETNFKAVKEQRSTSVAEALVAKGESEDVAELVSRKIKGEILTIEEAERVAESEFALEAIAEQTNKDYNTEELLTKAKGMAKKDAALFVALYDGKTDVDKYADAYELAVAKSEGNFTIKDILSTKGVLSGEQITKIYEDIRVKTDKAETARFRSLVEATANKKFYKGFVDDSVIDYNNTSAEGKVNWNSLKPRQRKAITFMNGFAKVTGLRLVWTVDADVNGSYNRETNTITLDVNAGIDNERGMLEDTIIPTSAHELTHWMEHKSPELFRKISDLVFDTLGGSETYRITREIDKFLAREYKRKYEAENPGKKISLDKVYHSLDNYVSAEVRREAYKDSKRIADARSEIVARACEDVLAMSEQGKKIFNSLSEAEQKTFVDKIKEIIQDIIDWVSDFLNLYKDKSVQHEAEIMRQYKDKLEELVKLWDAMLEESVEVNQALEKSGEFGHKKSTTEGEVLNSIREEYANEIDLWKKEGMSEGETFILGTTGDVLQGLGAIESDIYMLGDKIKEILAKHPEMSIEEIKRIPEILENPVLILKSQNVKRNENNNTRLVIYGTVKAQDGKPILSVLDLRPIEKNLVVDDMQKVTSAYTKDTNPVDFVKNSLVVYADKKRTTKLLKSIGFQMPIELQQSGYIGSISYFKRSVNIKGEEFSKIFKEDGILYSDRDSSGRELSEGQMEYFKDSAVRDKDGNLLVMYRGDSSEFTVFDRKKSRASNLYGRGFYFTNSKAHAEQYGKAREFYLNIKNPLAPKQNVITKNQMLAFLKAIENDGEDYDLYNYGEDSTAESVLSSVWGKGDFEMLQDVNASAIGDLVAAVELFNEVNGTRYDGIILPTETVTFKSNQAKSTSNLNPTEDEDILFSMRENVEKTKDLVAVHNMQVSELERTLDLGGLPMPSIAIVKAKSGHSEYGDVSLVFPKSTIDPKADKNNKVYGGDAWTPTYPIIEYKPSEKVSDRISKKYYELSRKFGYDEIRPLYKYVYELEDVLNRHKGEAGLIEELYEDEQVMQVYLLDIGKGKVETIKKEVRTELTDAEVEMNEFFIKELGADVVNAIMWDGNGTPMSYRKEYLSKYEDSIREAYKKLLSEEYHFTDEQVQNVMDSTKNSDLIKFMRDAYKYRENGRVTIKIEDDYGATQAAIKAEAGEGYREWIDSLFKGVEEKSGIRNNTDAFTNSGNRRSWEALHWENNLENVVKVMKSQDNGQTFFGGQAIWSVSAKDYSSVSEIKADSDRLKTMDKEQYEVIKESFGDRFNEIAVSMMDKSMDNYFIALDNAMECVIDALRHSKTKSGILNYLKQFKHLTVTETNVNDIVSLVTDISNMPTEYFEAKPKRAVGLNEIATAIIPDSTSEATKARLNDMGIKFLEYESGNENARLDALNSLDDVLFSSRDDVDLSERTYAYDELVSKNPMEVKTLQLVTPSEESKYKADYDLFAKDMRDIATSVGNAKNTETSTYLYCNDLGNDVQITRKSFKHGAARLDNAYISICKSLADVLSTSVVVNELSAREDTNGAYVLLGLAENTDSYVIIRSVVNKKTWKLEDYNELYAIKKTSIKKGDVGFKAPALHLISGYGTSPEISIANFLDFVNSQTLGSSVLSLDVVKHLNSTRAFDENVTPNLLYSERVDTSVYEMMGELDNLRKENEKIKLEVESLKERLEIEKTITHGTYVDTNKALAAAGHIRNIANSTYDKVKLAKEIKGIYTDLAETPGMKSEALFRRCHEIADNVLKEAKEEVVVNDYFKRVLKDIRTARISLDEMQKQEAKHLFGDHYNRNFIGRVVIAEDGRSLDSQWQEWANRYPEIFDADVNPNDQIGELYDIISTLQESSETVAEYDAEERRRWLAHEVLNTFWNLPTVETTADKYTKKIAQLRAEHNRRISEVRDRYKTKLAEQKKADKAKFKKLYSDLRDRKNAEVALAKEHGREMLEGYKERAERRTVMQSTLGTVMSLNRKLTTNSKEVHIPEALKPVVINLLNSIDFSSKQMLGMSGTKKDSRGLPTRRDIATENALNKVHSMESESPSLLVAVQDALKLFEDAEKVMHERADGTVDSSLVALDADSIDSIRELVKAIGIIQNEDKSAFVLEKMSLEHLKTLNTVVKSINHWAIVADKALANKHKMRISEASMHTIEENDALGKRQEYIKSIESVKKFFSWSNLLPVNAFKRLGNTAMGFFDALRDSQDKHTFNTQEIMDFTRGIFDKHKDALKWRKDVKEFEVTLPHGEKKTVRMPVSYVMTLYCVSKQEDAKRHLYGQDASGNKLTYEDDNGAEHDGGGMTIKGFKEKGLKVTKDLDNTIINEGIVRQITSSLTNEQREVADALQNFMDTKGSEWGNSVSMALYGIEKFAVKDYFPMTVSPHSIGVDNTQENRKSMFSILNYGFTKERNPGASQSIEIGDIFEIFANHMNMVSIYNAYALSVYDIARWYKFKGKDNLGKEISVTKSIENAFGDGATAYVSNLIRDLNGQHESSRLGFISQIFKNTKVAMVGNSLSVALLQPTAYLKAMTVVSPKYLLKSALYVKDFGAKKGVEKAKKYCGIALLKSQGYFETGVSASTTKKLLHDESFQEKVIEASLKGAEFMDERTWGVLWNACEFDVRENRKDLKVGSKEFYEVIGEKLRDVIYETQVVDSPLTKSELMRSPDGLAKSVTMFASEMTVAYNMVAESAIETSLDIKRNGKEGAFKRNGKRVFMALTAYTMTSAANAILQTAVQAFRDDDEEKELEDYIKECLVNFLTDWLIIGKIPYFKEAISLAQGYSSTRTETLWLESAFKAYEYWGKAIEGKDGAAMKAFDQTLKSISYISGFALYNQWRDLRALLRQLGLMD